MARITNVPLFLISLMILALYLKYNQNKHLTFLEYKQKYKLHFNPTEEKFREQVFYQNVQKIEAHNSNMQKTYQEGINKFTYLTQQEFVSIYLKTIVKLTPNIKIDESFISVQSVDWVKAGAVTRVKDQGDCGSCWAFSTTGSLQGLSKVKNGILQQFSQQQLLDCSQDYGNFGCQGGLMSSAFDYVKQNNISNQLQYPYKAKVEQCKTRIGIFKISGYTEFTGCTDLANAITSRPISVGVDATNWANYKYGILSICGTNLNHGVLLVGVTDSYWLVKNSWSQQWGQNGYIRLSRGNTCGICYIPSYPY